MPYKKVQKCAFHDCTSSSINTDQSDVQFFHFPLKYIDEWIKACKNDSLPTDPTMQKPLAQLFKYQYVCSKHFSNYDYKEIVPIKHKKHRLRPGAIPRESTGM